jgi:hypothetical protein
MNTSSPQEGDGAGTTELKKEGYFKMQIGGFLDLMIVNQDPTVERENIPGIVEHLSTQVCLKPENDRSPIPLGHLTVSKLARWFSDNQQSRAMPEASP